MADIRLLTPNEIEVRVQSVKQTKSSTGCILLLYKDARVDMKILDETFGMTGWKRTHELINGRLFCNIDIWDDEKKQWIRKQDVGVESYTEKEKGQASDAFKRAGFNVGIGRELYTSPFIWINLEQGETYQKDNKVALSPRVRFKVKSIEYTKDREIKELEIVDGNNKVRYSLGKPTVGKPVSFNNNSKNNIQNIQSKESSSPSSSKLKCEKCKTDISEKVANYSKSKFGHILCMDCQKGAK